MQKKKMYTIRLSYRLLEHLERYNNKTQYLLKAIVEEFKRRGTFFKEKDQI